MTKSVPSMNKVFRGVEKRSMKDGTDRFRVRIRRKGHEEISCTYRTAAIAVKNKHRLENALEDSLIELTPRGRHTFNELVQRYMESVLPQNPKNSRNKLRHLTWWTQKFGHLHLRDIKPIMIAQARDELLNSKTKQGTQLSPTTVVRYLSTLSHAFSIAVKELGWLRENPVFKIKKPQAARGRMRFLSLEEKDRLLVACKESQSSDLYLIVVLAICTGMRKGEILNLKWKNIDLEKGIIWLQETKNGEQRLVPLAEIPLSLLKASFSNQSQDCLVFPSRKNLNKPIDIRKAWKNALKKANISDCVFHTLRHTAASYLAMGQSSLIEIAAILGHKTLQTTKRYAHLSDQHLQHTAKTLEATIFNKN